jgi:acetyltransferase-like isoleucine patch superfamily enzyme
VSKDLFIHRDVEFKVEPTLGDHIAIDKGVYCTVHASIGDYVHIGPYVTIIGGKKSCFLAKGFNNIMAGARIICGSDRFDGSGLFGAMIPEELKGTQIIEPVIMEEFSNIGTNAIVLMNFNTVTEFENQVAEFFGAPYAVAVDACTHGVELSLRYTNADK